MGLLRVRQDLETEQLQQPLHNCKIKVKLVTQCYLLFITLEKEMATHSSIVPWKIPWTAEPGRLQSMGLQKDWAQLDNQTIGSAVLFVIYLINNCLMLQLESKQNFISSTYLLINELL